MNKPRVVKDYDRLEVEVQEQIKLAYPYGFEDELISFKNAEGKNVSALPFEGEDKYYLVRMTVSEAQSIIEEDSDYNDDGNLNLYGILFKSILFGFVYFGFIRVTTYI